MNAKSQPTNDENFGSTSSLRTVLTPPPHPIDPKIINYNRLKGTDPMMLAASSHMFPSIRAVFDRLHDAEQLNVDLYKMVTEHQHADFDLGNAEPIWAVSQVKIGFLFPASTIVDIPAGGFNLQRFLDTTIDIWTPNTFIPGIPPKNPGYLFDCRTLVTALSAIRYRKNSLLSGPTGCGKSTVIQQIAARLKRPYYRIPIDGEMRRREILGGWLQEATPTGSKTVWHDGMLTTAYQMPSIILLDEFDHADVDLVVSAHEALERQSLKLVEQPHRDIRMHPGCSITATANTRGAGDPIGIYGVKNRMSEASRNRFTYFISCNYLSISSEAKLLNAQNPNLALSTCEMIAEVASDIRAATIAGNIQTACSTRQTLDIAEDIAIQTEFDTSPVDQLLRKAFNTIMVSRAGDNYEEAAIIGILNAKLGAMP